MTLPLADAERFFAANADRCRLIEVHRDHYEITFWPKPKPPPDLFAPPTVNHDQLKADALAELSTPPQFTCDTHLIECERMAGIRSARANPHRKPTPKQLAYLRRFKAPNPEAMTFDQAVEFLDLRFGRKQKQEEMKINVAPSVTSP